LVDDSNFKIPEIQFKIAIISSLPPSWDSFMRPYISMQKGDNVDPKTHATSQELIGVIKEENVQRLRCAGKFEKQETVHQTCAPSHKPSLASRIDAEHCGQCSMRNHKTTDCRFLGQNKCGICDRFGHMTKNCFSKKAKELKCKQEANADRSGNKKKRFSNKRKRRGKRGGGNG
jgi:hypothetical protein